jgi:hypothetical protein
MRVWPPGPFPPTNALRGEGHDLSGRMLDVLYSRDHLTGSARDGVLAALTEAVQRQQWAAGAVLLQAALDTWPLGALIDEAARDWATSADSTALTVLARAAGVLQIAHGWPPQAEGPWPMPDEAWIVANAPEGATDVGRRGPNDAAVAVTSALDLPSAADQPWALPPIAEVPADALVAQRHALVRRLVRGEICAVRVTGEAPDDPAVQLALGEIRMEGVAQAAFERFGSAGLLAPDAPAFEALIGAPGPGPLGQTFQPLCDGILLPGPVAAMAEGTPQNVGWLLWDAPVAPVAVQPAAVAVLQAVAGESTPEAVASALGAPVDHVREILSSLIDIGAVSGVNPD